MSLQTIDRQKQSVQVLASTVLETPPLNSGDRLSRTEFERRYAAHPEIKKAELVEGVVYISSSTPYKHADSHFDLIGWVGIYRAATPVVEIAASSASYDLHDKRRAYARNVLPLS